MPIKKQKKSNKAVRSYRLIREQKATIATINALYRFYGITAEDVIKGNLDKLTLDKMAILYSANLKYFEDDKDNKRTAKIV